MIPSIYIKRPTTPVPHHSFLPSSLYTFPPPHGGERRSAIHPHAPQGADIFLLRSAPRAILRLAATISPTPPCRPIAELLAASSPIEGAVLRGGVEPRRAGLFLTRWTGLRSSPAAASSERPPRR